MTSITSESTAKPHRIPPFQCWLCRERLAMKDYHYLIRWEETPASLLPALPHRTRRLGPQLLVWIPSRNGDRTGTRTAPMTTPTHRRVKVTGDLYHGQVPDGAVYVGRAGTRTTQKPPYANPYPVKTYGLAESLRLYRIHAEGFDVADPAPRPRRQGPRLLVHARPALPRGRAAGTGQPMTSPTPASAKLLPELHPTTRKTNDDSGEGEGP